MRVGLLLMKNVSTPVANNVLLLLVVTASVSAIHGSEMTTLVSRSL